MAQFKIGGKVVCIEGAMWQSDLGYGKYKNVKGEIYTVGGIKECKCGGITLDIGIRYPRPDIRVLSECPCGQRTITDIVYCDSKRFLPIEEQEYRQMAYTKIIDEIPVCAQ